MMDVSLVAMIRNKASSFRTWKKDMSLFKLQSSTKDEPVIEEMDAHALSTYITMKAQVLDELQEGIQRSPSEASLLFTYIHGTERTKTTLLPVSQRKALKSSIRRGLMKLPGNIVLMNAAQSVRRHQIGYGVKSSVGQRPYMEDSHIIKPFFFRFPISLECTHQLIPEFVQTELDELSDNNSSPDGSNCPWSDVKTSMGMPRSEETIHCVFDDFDLFLVCDGHGGAQVAQYCTKHFKRILKKRLTTSVEERYMELLQSELVPRRGAELSTSLNSFDGLLPERSVKSASNLGEGRLPVAPKPIERSIRQLTPSESVRVRGSTDTDANLKSRSSIGTRPAAQCGLDVYHLRDCLTQSFLQMDAEVKEQAIGDFEGSTALAALVGSWHVCIANCGKLYLSSARRGPNVRTNVAVGDSRAVLSRGGQSIRITRDHKPHITEERSRIEEDGGFVLNAFGCSRVNGFLAMSRAIGDHTIPSVIARPDVTILHRHQNDEFLICATDGLWDVMTDEKACELTSKCLARAEAKGARHMATRVAANVLLKAALDKGSTDNITIAVVDLRMAKGDHNQQQ